MSEFRKDRSKKDGHKSHCKICCKEYDKEYQQTEEGKVAILRAIKKYQKTEKGKATKKRAIQKANLTYPKVFKANTAVNNAIRDGKLIKPKTLQCHYCSVPAIEYHHHKGYEPEFWLDVIPICQKCHIKQRS